MEQVEVLAGEDKPTISTHFKGFFKNDGEGYFCRLVASVTGIKRGLMGGRLACHLPAEKK